MRQGEESVWEDAKAVLAYPVNDPVSRVYRITELIT